MQAMIWAYILNKPKQLRCKISAFFLCFPKNIVKVSLDNILLRFFLPYDVTEY